MINRFAAIQMQQIRHFAALVDAGNFHRAAEQLNITQPGLTRSIQRLELALGQECIARGSRGVSVNAFGRVLYDYAVRMLNETDRLVMDLEEIGGDQSAVVRLGLAANFTDIDLAPLLADFALERPELRLVVTQGFFSDVMLKSLRRGELDIAIGLWPVELTAPDLVIERLRLNYSSVVCGPRSRFYGKRQATMKETVGSFRGSCPAWTRWSASWRGCSGLTNCRPRKS